jgi:tRNA(Arg) A34 adenosine deaminase TadA
MNYDEYFIKIVYELARESAKNNGDPFAAILVLDNEICHKSLDISVKSSNPTLHAELNVISEYCSQRKIISLDGYTLYCNVEPCIMCSGAIHWSRISKIVYGISQKSLQNISKGKQKPNCEELINIGSRKVEVIGPLLEEEGIKVFKEFPLMNKEERHFKMYGKNK